MDVQLIRYTPDPDHICGLAAAECYSSNNPYKALEVAMAGGHESVAEHAVFTFSIRGISRTALAQLTRHRIASFSVQSQRYVNITDNDVITPETIPEKYRKDWDDIVKKAGILYVHMVEDGVPKEDARFIIPQGVTTNLTMTMNARELRHFFSLRCCNRAQWEIRQLACAMLDLVKPIAPILFDNAGPACVRGKCPEKKPCGHPWKETTKE